MECFLGSLESSGPAHRGPWLAAGQAFPQPPGRSTLKASDSPEKECVMSNREHWEAIYEHKSPDEVSWYQPHLERSLRFIEGAGLSPRSEIIDIGGGSSTLVDDLLDRGEGRVTGLGNLGGAIAPADKRVCHPAPAG